MNSFEVFNSLLLISLTSPRNAKLTHSYNIKNQLQEKPCKILLIPSVRELFNSKEDD